MAMTDADRLERGLISVSEDKARQQVIERWKRAGLPWPAPPPEQVEAMKANGHWPPGHHQEKDGTTYLKFN